MLSPWNEVVLALDAEALRVYEWADWQARGAEAAHVSLSHGGRPAEQVIQALAGRPKARVAFFNRVHLVVGNPWARPGILPWQAGLYTETAWDAYARAWFAARTQRGQWSLRVQDEKYGSPRLSVALCADTLAAIDHACGSAGWRLASARDELSSLLGRHTPIVRQADWCLVLAERHVVTCLFREDRAWRDLVMLPRARSNAEEWLATGSLLSDLTIPKSVYISGVDLPEMPKGAQLVEGWRGLPPPVRKPAEAGDQT
ncbi:hypothetical protein MyNCGM683_21560 [Achromobacter xylosoxidans]